MAADVPPQIIDGRFETLSLLGEGGVGVVYRAFHRDMNRHVALKLMKAPLTHSPEQQLRFRRESKIISALDHPNIVSIYSMGIAETGAPYIAMELLEGEPLSELIKARGAFAWRIALPLFVQVCSALDHAHSKQIIHRDIKPSNIMVLSDVDDHARVKVVDFGIAKAIGDDALTRTNVIAGSAFYLSPNQCEGRSNDEQSDIYALGCSLFETVAGRPPFMGESFLETLTKHRSDQPPKVSDINPACAIPAALEEVIACCLSKAKETRYRSVSELRADLENVLAGKSASYIPASVPPTAGRSRKLLVYRKPAATIGSALAVLTMLAGVLYFVLADGTVTSESSEKPKSELQDSVRTKIMEGKKNISGGDHEQAEKILAEALGEARNLQNPELTLSAARLFGGLLERDADQAYAAGDKTKYRQLRDQAKQTYITALSDLEKSGKSWSQGEQQQQINGELCHLAAALSKHQAKAGNLAQAKKTAAIALRAFREGPQTSYQRGLHIKYLSKLVSREIELNDTPEAMKYLRERIALQEMNGWEHSQIVSDIEKTARDAESAQLKNLARQMRAVAQRFKPEP